MGFGNFAGGLATGWMGASKMIGEDEDRAERRKSLEVERESRRLENDEKRAAAESRRRMDEAAGVLAQGGKTKTAAKVGDNTYSNIDDANAAAGNENAFREMEVEAALDGQDRESPITPAGAGPVTVAKTETPYTRAQAIGDATAKAGPDYRVQEMVAAREKLWKAEGYDKAFDTLRRTGDLKAALDVFDDIGDGKAHQLFRTEGAAYDPKTDTITLPGKGAIKLDDYQAKFMSFENRKKLENETKKADAAVRAADNRGESSAVRDALAVMRGMPGFPGAATGTRATGSAGTGTGAKGSGDVTKNDRKSFDADPEKPTAVGDHAYLAFTQLTDPANNPGLADSEKGKAAARMLANQLANGQIKAAPELGPDFRWSFVVKSAGGNSYVLDRPEWGVDPTSVLGKDGKPLVDAKAVAEQEAKALDSLKKGDPKTYQQVAELAANPTAWKNIRDTYDLAKAGQTPMSKPDFSAFQRQMMIGETMRRRAAAPPPGDEKQDTKKPQARPEDVEIAKKYGITPPPADGVWGKVKQTYGDGWQGMKAAHSDGVFENTLQALRVNIAQNPRSIQGPVIALADLVVQNPEYKKQLSADELALVRTVRPEIQ